MQDPKISAGMSRRRMLQLTGVAGLGAFLAGCAKEEVPVPEPAEADTTTSLKVYDPSGSVQVTQLFSPRLDTLDGKTIAFVADDAWEDERTFAVIKQLLEKNYPTINIITQDNFIHGIGAITAAKNGIPEKMKELGVDGAIIGNAG